MVGTGERCVRIEELPDGGLNVGKVVRVGCVLVCQPSRFLVKRLCSCHSTIPGVTEIVAAQERQIRLPGLAKMHFIGKIDAKECYGSAVKSAEVGTDVVSKCRHAVDSGKGRGDWIGRPRESCKQEARDNGDISAVPISMFGI